MRIFLSILLFVGIVAFLVIPHVVNDGVIGIASIVAMIVGMVALHYILRPSVQTEGKKAGFVSVLLAIVSGLITATLSIILVGHLFRIQNQWDGGLAGMIWIFHPGLFVFILTIYFYLRFKSYLSNRI